MPDGLMGETCGVRIYRARADSKCDHEFVCGCEKCRIGCYKPARWRNPWFGKDYPDEDHWWRNPYSYAEFLCAEHYDDATDTLKEYEELYGGDQEDQAARP
jgi:hypothetical protein